MNYGAWVVQLFQHLLIVDRKVLFVGKKQSQTGIIDAEVFYRRIGLAFTVEEIDSTVVAADDHDLAVFSAAEQASFKLLVFENIRVGENFGARAAIGIDRQKMIGVFENYALRKKRAIGEDYSIF